MTESLRPTSAHPRIPARLAMFIAAACVLSVLWRIALPGLVAIAGRASVAHPDRRPLVEAAVAFDIGGDDRELSCGMGKSFERGTLVNAWTYAEHGDSRQTVLMIVRSQRGPFERVGIVPRGLRISDEFPHDRDGDGYVECCTETPANGNWRFVVWRFRSGGRREIAAALSVPIGGAAGGGSVYVWWRDLDSDGVDELVVFQTQALTAASPAAPSLATLCTLRWNRPGGILKADPGASPVVRVADLPNGEPIEVEAGFGEEEFTLLIDSLLPIP